MITERRPSAVLSAKFGKHGNAVAMGVLVDLRIASHLRRMRPVTRAMPKNIKSTPAKW